MARTLSCDFHFDLPNFEKVSDNAKDFISKLLILNAEVNQINAFISEMHFTLTGEVHS